MIIPRKEAVTGDIVDTYLQPLMEELLMLWSKGVEVRDASEYQGSLVFRMHAVLLYCMHDLPAYGTLFGRVTSGFRACPLCGPNTILRRSASLRKVVYGR
jgi:hypothetical protein